MTDRPTRNGFTLIELMVVVVLMGILAASGTMAFRSWQINQMASQANRQLADLLLFGRSESIRTGVNHIAFFNEDPTGVGLTLDDGTAVAALLVVDNNGNGRPDAGEMRGFVPLAPASASLAWGRAFATTLVPNNSGARMGDPFDGTAVEGTAQEIASAGNFRHPTAGNTVNTWVLFAPDGTPRASVPNGPGITVGAVGSGDGAVYVTNQIRDYAVVMAPLGGVRTFRWDTGASQWR